jgi:hypothetical protein
MMDLDLRGKYSGGYGVLANSTKLTFALTADLVPERDGSGLKNS